jgi:hypothetical protein
VKAGKEEGKNQRKDQPEQHKRKATKKRRC